MKGLEEARGRFAAAPPAESAAAVEPPRRAGTLLSRALGRLGPALDATRNLLVSAAIVAILLVIGWSILAETRREAIVVERIAVPRRLGEAGLDGEVLASRLVDAIAEVSEAAFWRGERPTVAMGWKTADFQVPLLGLSMGALVRLLQDLAGRPDRRVSGEFVQIDGAETLRLRITPPGGALEPITLAVEPTATDRAAVDAALERGAERLLEKLDPIALAAHRLVARLERLPEPADPAAALSGLDAVVAALNACLIEPVCRERDGERAHLLWATAAWRAALRLDERSRDGREALLEEALDRLALARGLDGPSLEAMLRRGDVLAALGRTEEAREAFAEAARRHPGSARPLRDWAKALARAGAPKEAVDKLERAVVLEPENAWIRFELGMAHRAAGREAEAIDAFREATRRDGRLHCAFEEWGRALEAVGRIEAAARRLERAARLRGASPHCRWPDP
jgi:tetratricopeptide (TPR) repeat protein